MANGKVQVNGSSSGTDPSVQSQITAALLQNGGVKRIQDTMKQHLDEEGWSENLRKYLIELFRSGEANTYEEAWNKVMQQTKGEGAGVTNGVNGDAAAVDLRIPQSAKTGGVEVVKKELAKICVMGDK